MDSLWGGVAEGWHETNFAGADWFMNNLGFTDTGSGNNQYWAEFWYGNDSDVAAVPGSGDTLKGNVLCNYAVDWFPPEYYAFDSGWFTDQDGLSIGLTPGNEAIRTIGWDPFPGSLLVRFF